MTIDQTIQAAAEKFGTTVEAIRGRRKGGEITKAREWIVSQHPEQTCAALAAAMNRSTHHSVMLLRRKLTLSRNSR